MSATYCAFGLGTRDACVCPFTRAVVTASQRACKCGHGRTVHTNDALSYDGSVSVGGGGGQPDSGCGGGGGDGISFCRSLATRYCASVGGCVVVVTARPRTKTPGSGGGGLAISIRRARSN